MGVAFENGPVHKGSGITFIAVADQVALIVLGVKRGFPFTAGREAPAATASESALYNNVANLVRCIVPEYPYQRAVPPPGNIFSDGVWIDDPAVSEYQSVLKPEVRHFPQ